MRSLDLEQGPKIRIFRLDGLKDIENCKYKLSNFLKQTSPSFPRIIEISSLKNFFDSTSMSSTRANIRIFGPNVSLPLKKYFNI